MSTKDLIERLNRTPVRTTRTTPSRPATDAAGSAEVQTRVSRRVIRRRPRHVEPEPTPTQEPTARRTVRRAAKPAAPVTPVPAVSNEPQPAPAQAAPAQAAPAQAAPAQAAPAQAAPAQAAPAQAAPAQAAPAQAAPVEATTAPAVDDATAAKASPPKAPTVEPAAASVSAPDAVQVAQVAPVVAPAVAPPPVEAAPAETPPEVPATPQAQADGGPLATSPPVAGDATAAPAAPAPDASVAAGAPVQSVSETARRGLPRLSGDGRSVPAFPGLGSAVVAPPPGYDPSDPAGNRRRAQESARRSAEPAASAHPGKPVWRDERTTPGAARTDFKPRDRGPVRPRPKRRRRAASMNDFSSAMPRRRRGRKRAGPKKVSPQAAAHKRRVEVNGSISVANLAYGMSVKASQVIKSLMALGQMVTINEELDLETAQLVAPEFQFEAVDASFSEEAHFIEEEQLEEEGQKPRPPVVTIMGHVDHGKTTLLDSIRKASVAEGEAGGITQHTSAYQVEQDGQIITFIDTPGHEAFTEMRARGAQVTDIVVLVVAADDGVMPQTVEAINHSKAAGVQILVAINKIDKPGVQIDRIKQALMEYELVPEDYGGDTIFVPVSALRGDGIGDLLEAINLLAEVAEFTANPDRHAEGSVLEARLEKGRGPVANALVQAGTLKQGDRVVVGTTWGRVRAMTDYRGKKLKKAGPSTPVEIIGLQDVPGAGDNFVVVANDKAAKALAEHRVDEAKRQALSDSSGKKVTLEDLLRQKVEGEKLNLNLVVKADVGGTLEAMKMSISKVAVEGTDVKVLHSAVGAISESDITLARTYGAVVIGFNVRPDSKARRTADEYGIEVRTYRVIYEALEDIEKALKGLLGPTFEEKVNGVAEIREIFSVPKIGTIAGCRVIEGTVSRNHAVRLLRDGTIVWTGRLASLRRFKDDVREVSEGYECGMNLDGFNDLKPGDHIEAFSQQEVVAD